MEYLYAGRALAHGQAVVFHAQSSAALGQQQFAVGDHLAGAGLNGIQAHALWLRLFQPQQIAAQIQVADAGASEQLAALAAAQVEPPGAVAQQVEQIVAIEGQLPHFAAQLRAEFAHRRFNVTA